MFLIIDGLQGEEIRQIILTLFMVWFGFMAYQP